MELITLGIELNINSNLPVPIPLQLVLSGTATAHGEHTLRSDVTEVANTTTKKSEGSYCIRMGRYNFFPPCSIPPPLGPHGGARQVHAP